MPINFQSNVEILRLQLTCSMCHVQPYPSPQFVSHREHTCLNDND